MSQEILVNQTPTETRAALLEGGVVSEVLIERSSRRAYIGNIYLGRVSRVLPGMQAAFVDIGLERAAFLHVADIVGPREAAETAIADKVREGQDLLVQVIKDPIGSKGARLSTQISLPSRYLVYMPASDQIGVSVRIEDGAERDRLRQLVEEAMGDAGGGVIVRTNAEGVDRFAIRADLSYLRKVWELIRERRAQARPGQVVYEDLSVELRLLRDMVNASVERIRVDDGAALSRMKVFAEQFIPEWGGSLELYSEDRAIFDIYGVEDEIAQALKRTVRLKSGGHLVIDQTEAMTTIDVNTGAFVGHRNQAETIFRTNLEAAQALARQLRLRNLGGIIIIDFIDMAEPEHQEQVMKTLLKALAQDPAKTYVAQFSSLGLVEMTRKRTSESLARVLCEPCLVCSGRGYVKTAETVCHEIFREITLANRQFEAEQLMVMACPTVVNRILEEESATVAEIEEAIGKTIHFKADDEYAQEQFDVVLL